MERLKASELLHPSSKRAIARDFNGYERVSRCSGPHATVWRHRLKPTVSRILGRLFPLGVAMENQRDFSVLAGLTDWLVNL